MTEPGAIRLIREELEATLGPTRAVSLLFDALNRWGGRVPATRDEVANLVAGPLRELLHRELGPGRSQTLVGALESLLDAAEVTTGSHVEIDVELPPAMGKLGSLWREEDRDTEDVLVPQGALGIVVLSAARGFGEHLAAVLGAGVRVITVQELTDLGSALASAHVVLVDGGNPPRLSAEEVIEALVALPSGVWRTVWAVDLPFGRQVVDALEERSTHCVPLSAREGIAPLIDLLRSRKP